MDWPWSLGADVAWAISERNKGGLPFCLLPVRSIQFIQIYYYFLAFKPDGKPVHVASRPARHENPVRLIFRLVPLALKMLILRPPMQRGVFRRASQRKCVYPAGMANQDYLVVRIDTDRIGRREIIGALGLLHACRHHIYRKGGRVFRARSCGNKSREHNR